MSRASLLLLLLCAGCLDYHVAVQTAVAPDGAVRRTIRIAERSDKHETWKGFAPPGPPYMATGNDQDGFVAEASVKAGSHESGIAPRLGEGEEAEAVRAKFTIEAMDLLVGKLYRYDERIPLGIDPERFRREVPARLDEGLVFLLEALRIGFPEVDFAGMEKRAREQLLPSLRDSIFVAHAAAQLLVSDLREHRSGGNFEEVLAHPQARVILGEMAKYGWRRRPDAPKARSLEDYFVEEYCDAPLALLDSFLSPLPEAERAVVRAGLLGGEEAMEGAFEAAEKKLYPEGNDDLAAFACSLIGAVNSWGFGDSYSLDFEVSLPGELLATNGEIAGAAGCRWHFDSGDLAIIEPRMSAWSFVPAEGMPAAGWRLHSLIGVADAVRALDAGEREEWEALYRLQKWQSDNERVKNALEAVRAARDEARG